MQLDSTLVYGHCSNGSDLIVYDVQMNSWPMRFCRIGGNVSLTQGWSRFGQAKQQRDTITFYELNYLHKIMDTQKHV